jgi:hypothetical protein
VNFMVSRLVPLDESEYGPQPSYDDAYDLRIIQDRIKALRAFDALFRAEPMPLSENVTKADKYRSWIAKRISREQASMDNIQDRIWDRQEGC